MLASWDPVWLTLRVSITATVFSVSLGLLLAWFLARKDFRGKNLLDAILMQPMVIPPTVLGYYLLVLFGRGSSFGRLLERWFDVTLVFTWQGAVLAAMVASMPLFIKPARAAIESVDRQLENAARLLGRSEWSVFRTITLPLAWRGIVAGAVMAFARAMGEFGTTLMVAGNIPGRTQTVSIAIYDAVQAGDQSRANVLVLLVTVFSIGVLWFVSRITAGRF
ncbi:MAG: molybdate ABC transporter permease subunit [SAR324 cluster bacterium]|nr:molybdate ABC transporter permease subunit [SAR324 cluster bacterium]MCZ6559066.1 molybdate ABC transporter permease subunit [SAR324 cluster bacterium]